MRALLIATRNPHKTQEIREILGPSFDVRDLSEHPNIPPPVESGKTFKENALLKAVAVSCQYDGLVLADDSGLEVDALNGAPGIFSARYAGEKASDSQNMNKLLSALAQKAEWPNFPSCDSVKRQVENLPHFPARFRCVIAIARNGRSLAAFEGVMEGSVISEARGSNGFGYDPIFVPNGFDQTFAELPHTTKNQISHRAKALHRALTFLKAALQ